MRRSIGPSLSSAPRLAWSFDLDAVDRYVEVAANRTRAERPIDALDAQIAAICLARGAALATRNTRDFEGVGLEVVDPWAL